MSTLRIGLGQLNTKDNIRDSFKSIESILKECSQKSVQLVIFPELSTYLSESGVKNIAEKLDGKIITRFRELAVKYGLNIHNGSFVEEIPNSNKVYNTSVFISSSGEIESVYRKIHLFDIDLGGELNYRESDRFVGGREVVTLNSKIGDFGFSICYDLRFPELYRKLGSMGAKLIFVPAAFTLFTGKDHWETLLRARAIENQVYIAAPNQIGEHPENKLCYGNSMVIDPWGKIIARASDKPGLITAEIDFSYVSEIRGKLPSLKNTVNIENLQHRRQSYHQLS